VFPVPEQALAAWTGLNDRQQGTLRIIYEIDQGIEAWRRQRAARGDYDSSPAATWRRIDFAHDPSGIADLTDMQMRLDCAGWHNQGNGSTVAALADRGLVSRGQRGTVLGVMLTVTLTRKGRAAARAGLSLQPGGKPKAALSERAWEVLGMLWAAGQRGETLKWGYSRTIEFVLIGKHVPPLAEDVGGGYRITARGQDFYREQYAAHAAAHPGIRAPHPDGVQAEPWPAAADSILERHRRYYYTLCSAWRDVWNAHHAASTEAAATPATTGLALPGAVIAQVEARRELWRETARQRADMAAVHLADLDSRMMRAARGYAVAALAAFTAAVTQADPLDVLEEPGSGDSWDEPRMPPPPATGIHAIDDQAGKLHAAAVGQPVPRRGPAPKTRRRRAPLFPGGPAELPAEPGTKLAALGSFLQGQTAGGALVRRLHTETPVS
jgi:hypothetical protein